MADYSISLAVSNDAVRHCYPVISQLRPHLSESEFVSRVSIMRHEGYHLVYLEKNGEIISVAGYRFSTMLSRGRFMYIDDLVTDEPYRGKGYGKILMDWMFQKAQDAGCNQIDLDSGVQRFDAHEFYFRKKMKIISYHFTKKIK
ncbi:MAG: GNAT family N-acetyltransferase [Bacteroidetes bacterium]|nr:GNAT family N-acetyltransferase [Bacteroidota bacterium]